MNDFSEYFDDWKYPELNGSPPEKSSEITISPNTNSKLFNEKNLLYEIEPSSFHTVCRIAVGKVIEISFNYSTLRTIQLEGYSFKFTETHKSTSYVPKNLAVGDTARFFYIYDDHIGRGTTSIF